MICLMALTCVMQSCKDNDAPTPSADLQKTWIMGTGAYVWQGGQDRTANYQLMTITFYGTGTYTTQNAGKLLPATGTWYWETLNTTLMLDGDFPVDVLTLDQTTLRIKFYMDAEHVNASGRTNSLVGDYEILFKND